jgi:WhiB family redox-sensing transcriptional regulator
MTRTEPTLHRARAVIGSAGAEQLTVTDVRQVLRALLFDGQRPPAWRNRAVCADSDPALFFPGPRPHAAATANRAKRICAGCPVRVECLADVMAWEQPGHRHGVVGGLSARERRALHKTGRIEEGAA